MKYLALGDSYTIGEAVAESERWPHQLVDRLNSDGYEIGIPKIIATTGWTTDELQKAIAEENPSKDYDLVSLLIGVNNQYRGYPIEQYKNEFEALLNQAIEFANGNAKRVFVVSIPDYGVTPFAAEKDPPKIARELDEYNAIAQSFCKDLGVVFVNITDVSKQAADDAALNAEDNLHPSGKMYGLWTDLVYPEVKKLLEK